MQFRRFGILALLTTFSATAVLAKEANFDRLMVDGNGKAAATGYTSGAFSLSAIANRDRKNNPCIGYGGDETPDHIMVVKKGFPKLTVKVNTGGKDSTLVIKGPDGTIRCGDDTGSNKDASITDSNWKSGNYSIWVGSIKERQRWDYTLSVQQD
jgi:hypothetical protein